MKPVRLPSFLAVLLVLAVHQLFAIQVVQQTIGSDVVRMWRAGVAPETIRLFIRHEMALVSAEDVALMTEAGLPDRFIRDLVEAAASNTGDRRYAVYYPYDGPIYPSWFYGSPYAGIHLGGYFGGHYYSQYYRRYYTNGYGYGPYGHHMYGSYGHAYGYGGGSHGWNPGQSGGRPHYGFGGHGGGFGHTGAGGHVGGGHSGGGGHGGGGH